MSAGDTLDTALFTHRTSRSLKLPVVVSVPHAGLRVPDARAELMTLPPPVFHRDVDYEIHRMWQDAVEAYDVSFIKAEIHRYALDLNRDPASVGAKKGLIWIESTRGEPLGPAGRAFEPLPAATVDELVAKLWKPYYAFIERELARVRDHFGFAIFIDGHSMPSRGTAFHADPGGHRADIVPGDNRGQACSAKLLDLVSNLASQAGFDVRPNDPYSGGRLTTYFGRPADGIHALQIEVNRALYLSDEERVSEKALKAEGLTKLRSLATSILSASATFRP